MRRREFLGTVSASILAGTLMGCSAGEKILRGPTWEIRDLVGIWVTHHGHCRDH